MQIAKIHIKGFRNYDDEEITLGRTSLIIGANDSGKTNLLMALRLLFDRSLSESDLDLSDSDYNVYTKADNIEITVYISDIKEACLISEFGKSIHNGQLILRYTNSKSGEYEILAGFSEDTLDKLSSRSYLRRLNMQYVNTNRNLFTFLRHEKRRLLEISMARLEKEEEEEDQKGKKKLQDALNDINKGINNLHYVASALDTVNRQLKQLSVGNEDQKVRFATGGSDVDKMLDDVDLAFLSGDDVLSLGGDGRNNQIFFATWIAEQETFATQDHVTFYAIEEPEAHLHPHQQRKLSEYLAHMPVCQILITSHSPNIAGRFLSRNIVRLYLENKITHAASSIGDKTVQEAYDRFGYRMNPLSAELLFADGVFLVEGVSEVIFYNALAAELGMDLDRLNITILAVEGIGFAPYVKLCQELHIPWTLRTDNDIFSKKGEKTGSHYYAGTARGIKLAKEVLAANELEVIESWTSEKPSDILQKKNREIRDKLEEYHIYLADEDLESDLARSGITEVLQKYYSATTVDAVIKKMKNRKAENMFAFIRAKYECLPRLRDDPISKPLEDLADQVREGVHPK